MFTGKWLNYISLVTFQAGFIIKILLPVFHTNRVQLVQLNYAPGRKWLKCTEVWRSPRMASSTQNNERRWWYQNQTMAIHICMSSVYKFIMLILLIYGEDKTKRWDHYNSSAVISGDYMNSRPVILGPAVKANTKLLQSQQGSSKFQEQKYERAYLSIAEVSMFASSRRWDKTWRWYVSSNQAN